MNRLVVVTGASTGIGRSCAQQLTRHGFRVLASVRQQADADALAAEGLTPLMLDVSDAGSISAAREAVAAAADAGGLWGLVNNAGIAITGPAEFVPLDAWRRQMEVNVIGQVAMIQALLPLLRTARGRIVNVTSIGGRIAAPLFGPYSASKFAFEAVSDTLRRELRPWGIDVSVVEPGATATPIWGRGTSAAMQLYERMPAAARELYGRLIDATMKAVEKMGKNGTPPSKVAEAVEHALTSDSPRARYLVGTDAKLQAALASVVSDRVLDALMAMAGPKG